MKNIYSTFILLIFIGIYLSMTSYSSGPATAQDQGYTGAPNESGAVCGTCHNSGNFGTPSVSIVLTEVGNGMPITAYVPMTTYNVRVTVSATAPGYGFQFVALDGGGNSAGTFLNAGTDVQFVMVSNGRTYVEQNNISSTGIFDFQWTAPASGNVDFYAVGNAVNRAGDISGDNGSAAPTQLTLTAFSPPATPSNYVSISNDPTHVADPSAILDVQSTEKGILLPRMTQAERMAITSPAQGLLVYDTNNGSFWLYNNGWQEIMTSSNLQTDVPSPNKFTAFLLEEQRILKKKIQMQEVQIEDLDEQLKELQQQVLFLLRKD